MEKPAETLSVRSNQKSRFETFHKKICITHPDQSERRKEPSERESERNKRRKKRGGKTLEGKHVRDVITSMTQAGPSSTVTVAYIRL